MLFGDIEEVQLPESEVQSLLRNFKNTTENESESRNEVESSIIENKSKTKKKKNKLSALDDYIKRSTQPEDDSKKRIKKINGNNVTKRKLDLNLKLIEDNSESIKNKVEKSQCVKTSLNDGMGKIKRPKLESKETLLSKKNNCKNKKVKTAEIDRVHQNEADEEITNAKNCELNMDAWTKLGVPEIVIKALADSGFENPTPIQNLTLPAAIFGKKDIVGAAETGSGKTLAFVIPIVCGILKERPEDQEIDDQTDEEVNYEANTNKSFSALILTPTRELAVQIKTHIDTIVKYAKIKVVAIVGGLSQQKQERLLRGNPEIVIATIGRFCELVNSGNEYLSTLSKIKYLAIDETDRMIERGHFTELEGILDVLNSDSGVKKSRQNFIFSATLSFTHEPPKRFKKFNKKPNKTFKKESKKVTSKDKLQQIMEMVGIKENAKIVDITTGKGTCETLTEMSISCPLNQKDYYLYYFFVSHPGRTIVFCNSINCVRRLVNLFYLLQCEPLALHSEMVQKQRLRSLERFKENEKGILIATDVAARGLDIIDIEHVIHYQVPKTAESYIHRSGRTARAFKGGLALVLVEPDETSNFWHISKSLGRDKPLPTFPIDGQIFRDIKARVDLGIRVEQFEHQVRKKCAHVNWVEKARREMDLLSSEEDSDDEGGKSMTKKNIKNAKSELTKLKEKLSQLIGTNSLILKRGLSVSDAFKKIINEKTKGDGEPIKVKISEKC